MITELRKATEAQLDELAWSSEYAEYIMNNCAGDRLICNGDTLIEAQEDFYLFEEFLASLGLTE